MDRKKMKEVLEAAKNGDYSKLEGIKNIVSQEQYEAALKIFNEYSQKPEEEILKELARLRKTIPNQQEMINKIIPLLNEEQKSKLQRILETLDKY